MAEESETPPAPAPAVGPSQRLMSLDALRGFDMFWIIGADGLFHALDRMTEASPIQKIARQLDHADWIGFRFYDLIFPLFVFIVGVSLAFSLTNTIVTRGKLTALRRILRRSALLYLFALIFYGGFSHEWPDIRLVGVLNRIALCYLFAGLMFCFFRRQGLVILCVSLLVGYWALMKFVPFPDVRPQPGGTLEVCNETGFTNVAQLKLDGPATLRGVFVKGVNLANYVDQKYLPGKKWDGTWDPEGLLSTLPAIANCLLGVLAGLLLQNQDLSGLRKVLWLAIGGLVGLGLGYVWGLQFPIIKKIWTSSYVLVACGWSALLLATFYLVVDVLKFQFWCRPFVWIGMNPITVYMANDIVGFSDLAKRFAGGDVRNYLDRTVAAGCGDLVIALVALGLGIALVRFLYRRQIFLRV